MDMCELLAAIGAEDWEGDMDVLTCPCGYLVEFDGRCPEGCISPLRLAGII